MQILQITDPHLHGSVAASLRGVQTDASLHRVLAAASAHAAAYSAVLVTGDVVQDDPAGYLRFMELLGGRFAGEQPPVLCIPGNHDEPEAMRHTLSQMPFHYCGAHAIGRWQFIMLDSCDPGHVGGRLSSAELERLDSTLANSTAHALVGLHHHPVAVGSRWLDDIGLANADELWRVLDAYDHVRGVVWGHVHQAYDGERKRVRLMGTPSTCAQFLPRSDRYAVDSSPPAYRWLELDDDGRIRSEIRWVDAVAAPRHAAAG